MKCICFVVASLHTTLLSLRIGGISTSTEAGVPTIVTIVFQISFLTCWSTRIELKVQSTQAPCVLRYSPSRCLLSVMRMSRFRLASSEIRMHMTRFTAQHTVRHREWACLRDEDGMPLDCRTKRTWSRNRLIRLRVDSSASDQFSREADH